MTDLVFGLLAIVMGLILCLRGQWALRVLIAIWGAFVGLTVGAGLVSAVTDQGFLDTIWGWIAGVVLAVIFAALAYLYYAIGIVLAMAAMGFVLGGTLASALGITGGWLHLLIGAVCGAVLALVAILANLPQIILIVVSALAGASILTSGIMVVVGVVKNAENVSEIGFAEQPWWYAAYLVVAIIGVIVQLRLVSSPRAPVRDSWSRSRT